MAFMAMKKNLDERARKKAFDEIFEKFDRNKNGCVKKVPKIVLCMWSFEGTMYAKDFVREINNQVKVSLLSSKVWNDWYQ